MFLTNSLIPLKEETKVLIVATVAWGLRKCSRAIMLVLIFIIATKPGFIHAVYLIFFFVYLLSHDINEKMRQSLILLCEAHFAVLYILQLNLITETLEHKSSLSMVILSQLGLLQSDSYYDFLEIAVLACFCAVHNHGFDVLFSFSAIVQHAPCPPVGFSILKAGLNKSVLLSVYASSTNRDHDPDHSHEKRIASYLSAIGQRFLSVYRSFGTYIAFITILITVYLVTPNYVSFGYIFLLLLWIIGRQLVEKTKRRLWYPLKVYAISVFVLIYSLSIFPTFEAWVSRNLDIQVYLGYHHGASLLENVWQSLAIVIVMQMYSYERRQSKYFHSEDPGPSQFGVFGFIRRFLIWHSQKILFIALFYASLSPISAFGLFYLLGLVLCSTLPKASRIPSKLFLIYTGLIVATEYLFQMWGKQAGMFPGQKHYALSVILGLEVYRPSFWGLEAGLRAKVLVIAACTLQYNVFHWLEKMPASHLNDNRSGEPCPLFVSEEDVLPLVPDGESKPAADSSELSTQGMRPSSKSWPYLGQNLYQSSDDVPSNRGVSEYSNRSKYSFGSIWGSRKESHKWNKRLVVSLRKERLEMQKTTLKIYLKFWVENMFNLFGLEINMLALLLASFALLNAVSLLYIALLASCVLLKRRIICKVWPIFVLLLTLILLLEYFAMWKSLMPLNQHPPNQTVHCHDCWSSSDAYFDYCKKCWLGFTVDDPRTLISYYVVFMLACFKLRADRTSSLSGSFTYRQMVSQRKNSFVWRDLSFETKSMWTFLDYLRLYCYCHLLDLVLALILITGTLEYDVLHLGYLGFALIFFRMRLTILKKKNEIFKYLRMYNFTVIVLSLAYQSPFIGDFNAGKCETIDYIYEVIGFYKYDYGFRITSRSALVEIIIFVLVSLQSYMFSSPEFEYVFRYLEAEQIGAVVREQEKKAAWKTAQLQYIRESEEKKRQRNLQVEKMKSEMLNLQIQLHSTDTNSAATRGDTSPPSEGIRRRRNFSVPNLVERKPEKPEINVNADSVFSHDFPESPNSSRAESPFATELMKHPIETPLCEISEVEEDAGDSALNLEKENKRKGQSKDNPLVSAVQLIGDGVSQVQSIGNQAVNNIVSFLNIPSDDSDSNETSTAGDGISCERDSENTPYTHLDRSSSLQSDRSRTSEAASLQIGRIFCHMWSQIRSNYDVVCYCGFLLVFLWNFSLLSMVYLAALFLYALCVNTGPSYIFWVIMLIYTEIYILIQYLYQIIIQHCGFSIQSTTLQELGFPTKRITSAFVVSSLPLFLVYLFTLIQSSITAKDGEWFSLGYSTWKSRLLDPKEDLVASEWSEKVKKIFLPFKNMLKMVIRGCSRYWKSLTQEAESPPYFVQLSMDVHMWPEDGIQPERIESGINELLKLMHDDRCKNQNPSRCSCSSRVQIQSIEKSSENPNIALAVFEVVYACPLTECTHEQFKSLTPAADIAKEIRGAQSIGAVEKVGFPYRILSIIGGGRREVDLYAYIFGADLSVFFLVAIFYQSVKKNKSDFLDVSQLEDQFPEEYVFILMAIFFLIVVDRIIYLCSFATGKVIFYMSNLFLFTYVVTEYAWNIDAQQSAAGLALRAIYLTKAISLALQAIQIRYGVPHKSTLYRQFLTSKVSQINYLGYRLYRALPFLYELRCVLDWSCTRTSLTMYDWLKLEDINASLYLVKCDAVLNRATHKQGEKQTKMTKFCNGICLFFVLICVIWAPMLVHVRTAASGCSSEDFSSNFFS
ncbi:Piezo-type mechanosensitive ion channel -like protein [Capsicum chinense]|nr:Piezo-type mechanosensitive ion channel -like protein [Capsicum chinense]